MLNLLVYKVTLQGLNNKPFFQVLFLSSLTISSHLNIGSQIFSSIKVPLQKFVFIKTPLVVRRSFYIIFLIYFPGDIFWKLKTPHPAIFTSLKYYLSLLS